MILTAEHKQRIEANVDGVADLLTKAKLDDIQMPVVLKGDESHVYDLEPLIDYFVFQMRENGASGVKHPGVEGKELSLSDIEALTGEGIDEANDQRVKAVLADFEADAKEFLLRRERIASFTEAQIEEAASKTDPPGEEWKRCIVELMECDAAVCHFLAHVRESYAINFRLGDAKALLEAIQLHQGDNDAASAVHEKLEQLLEGNVEMNLISDFNHDLKTRIYICNPDEAEVERVHRREIAAQSLIAALTQEG